METEEWRVIPNNENYAVSSLGRVRRDKPGKGTRQGRIFKPQFLPNGYEYVDLYEYGIRTRLYVHQCMALAFIGPQPTPLHEVAHWDGNKANNTKGNIRWATHDENEEDSKRLREKVHGSNHPLSKLTEEQVLEMRHLRSTTSMTLDALGAKYGVTLSNVDFICRRVTWRHV